MIKGAKKGRDSILYGIQLMQSQKYLITSNSTNLIKELRNYVWDTDKTSKQLNKPKNSNDHLIDALRYHESESLGNKTYGQYFIK
jgi:phage terminase large subunit